MPRDVRDPRQVKRALGAGIAVAVIVSIVAVTPILAQELYYSPGGASGYNIPGKPTNKPATQAKPATPTQQYRQPKILPGQSQQYQQPRFPAPNYGRPSIAAPETGGGMMIQLEPCPQPGGITKFVPKGTCKTGGSSAPPRQVLPSGPTGTPPSTTTRPQQVLPSGPAIAPPASPGTPGVIIERGPSTVTRPPPNTGPGVPSTVSKPPTTTTITRPPPTTVTRPPTTTTVTKPPITTGITGSGTKTTTPTTTTVTKPPITTGITGSGTKTTTSPTTSTTTGKTGSGTKTTTTTTTTKEGGSTTASTTKATEEVPPPAAAATTETPATVTSEPSTVSTYENEQQRQYEEQRRREELIYLHEQAKIARQESKDRALSLLKSEDINLDGMLFAKKPTDFGALIAKAMDLSGAANPCPPEDGQMPFFGIMAPDDSGYQPHDPRGAGFGNPQGGPDNNNPFDLFNKRRKKNKVCPVKPGKKKKKIDAVDDAGATVLGTPTTIPVLGNDTYEGKVKMVALVAPRNGSIRKMGGSIKYTPRNNWTGNDAFSYRITDEDGNSDSAWVKVKVNSRPPPPPLGDACLKEVNKAGIDPLAAVTKVNTDKIVNQVYNQAANDLLPGDPIDAEIAQAEREMADAIGAGKKRTLPELGTVPSKGRPSFELATVKRQEAVNAKRQIVDAMVSHPIDEFSNLVAAQLKNPDKVPVHPLLTERDSTAAMRVYRVAKDPAMRKELDSLGKELVKSRDLSALPAKIAERADRLYRHISSPRMSKSRRQIAPDRIVRAKPKKGTKTKIWAKAQKAGYTVKLNEGKGKTAESIRILPDRLKDPRYLNSDIVNIETGKLRQKPQPLPDKPIFIQDRIEGRHFIKRMVEALPVLQQLENQRAGLKETLPDKSFNRAAAQVFMVQVAGKERIAAQRRLQKPGVGRVVGIGIREGGAVKQVALSKDLRLVEEQPIKPLSPSKIVTYRQQITLAKEAQAEAHIGMYKSKFSPKIERLQARASIAEAGLQEAARDQKQKNIRVAAASLPATKEVLDDVRSRVLAVTKAKGAHSQEFTKLQQPLKELTSRYQRQKGIVERVAAKQPTLKRALNEFEQASEARYTEAVRIKTEGAYKESLARREKILKPQYTKELQLSAVRTGAFQHAKSGARRVLPSGPGSVPGAKQTLRSRGAMRQVMPAGPRGGAAPAQKGSFRSSITEATKRNMERMGRGGEISGARVVPSGGSIYGGSRSAIGGGVKSQYGGVTDLSKWKPPQTAASGGTVMGGVISRSQLNDPDYVRNLLKQRLGGTLVGVHTKDDLQNPEYMEKLLRNRIGNFGHVQRFNNEDEYRDFVQSRLGQFGIAHKKSDLQDPEYYAKQFKARVGGFGHVQTFKDEDEMQKYVQSRLGQFGIAHKRSDLNNPEYYYRLLKERLGPFVNVHKFKSLDEYKKFVQSRLGGLGNVRTCLDMLDQGMSPEKISAIFDQARKFGKRDFESQEDYERRMLNDHPEEFKQLGNGKVVRKTATEKKAEREQSLLDSGEWIRSPTGTLLRRGSKAADQVVNQLFNQTRKISVTLDDGTKATLEVRGRGSFQDQFESALKAQGYKRDKYGDWRDKDGRFVMSGESIEELDGQYTSHIEKISPGYSGFIDRKPRPPKEQDTPKPPSPSEQLADLQDTVVNSVGYTVNNIKLDGRTIKTLEVRPGESVTEAIARASGGTYSIDEYGNVVDRAGEKVMPWWEADKLNTKYKDRVLESVFGKDFKGISAEFEALANSSDPKHRIRAQQIMASMQGLSGQIDKAVEDQRLAQDRIDAINAATNLSAREKRRQRERVQKDLDAATKQRKELETALFKQSQTANSSAKKAFENSLNYNEQQLLKANRKINDLTAEYESLDDSFNEPMSESDRRRRLRRMEDIRKEVFELSKESKDRIRKVEGPLSSPLLETPNTTSTFNFAKNAAVDAEEARNNAVYVRIDEETGKAYYVDANNEVIRDLKGKPIEISQNEALRFRDRVMRNLVNNSSSFSRTVKRYNDYLSDMADLKREIDRINADEIVARADGRELTSGQRGKRAALINRYNRLMRSAQRLEPDVQEYAQPLRLIQASETENAEFQKRREEDFQRKRESYANFIRGERHITYTDPETGETKVWKSDKQKAYEAAVEAERRRQAEIQRRIAETERKRREAAQARKEATERRARETREQAERETARREREGRQNRLNASFDRENTRLTTLTNEKTAADREVIAARAALDTLLARQTRASERGEVDREAAGQVTAARTRLNKAIQDRDLATQRLARQQDQQLIAAAAASINDDDFTESYQQQRSKVAALGGSAEDIRTSYEAIKALREQFEAQGDTQSQAVAAAYSAQEKSLEAAYISIATQQAAEQNALTLMRDQALFANASPEFNQRRLDQINQKIREGGGSRYSALNEIERTELERREALATYHNDVKAAFGHLNELADIAKKFGEDPNSLTGAERVKLDRGMSEAERNLITGELQRQGIMANLKDNDNLIQTTTQVSMIQDWMTSSDGARGGKRPLFGTQGGGDLDRVFDFVSGRSTLQARVNETRADITRLEKELRAAEQARTQVDDMKDPWYKVESSLNQVHLTRQLLSSARRRLRDQEYDLDRVTGTTSLRSDVQNLEWDLSRARRDGDKGLAAKLENQLTLKRQELDRARQAPVASPSTNGGFFELRVQQAQEAQKRAQESQAFLESLQAADGQVQSLIQARIGLENNLRATGQDPSSVSQAYKALEGQARQQFDTLQSQLVTDQQVKEKEEALRRLRGELARSGTYSTDRDLLDRTNRAEREYNEIKARQAVQQQASAWLNQTQAQRRIDASQTSTNSQITTLSETLGRYETNLSRAATQLSVLERQKKHYEDGKNEERFDEDWADEQIKKLEPQLEQARAVYNYQNNFVRKRRGEINAEISSLQEQHQRLLIRENPNFRQQQENERLQEIITLQRELNYREVTRASRISDIEARRDTLQTQFDNATDEKTKEDLEKQLRSVGTSLYEQQRLLDRMVRNSQSEIYDAYRKNAQDGVGPTDSYDLNKLAEARGISLSAAYLQGTDVIDRSVATGRTLTDGAVSSGVGNERTFASHFAEELGNQAKKLSNPLELGKAVAYTYYGFGKTIVTGVADTVEIIGEAAGIDSNTDKLDALAQLPEFISKLNSHRIGQLVDHGLRKMAKGDMDANAAMFGGAIATILTPTPSGSGLAAGLTHLATDATRLQRLATSAANVTQKLVGAGRTTRTLERTADLFGDAAVRSAAAGEKVMARLRGLDEALIAGVAARTPTPIANLARGGVDLARRGLERLPTFIYDPDKIGASALNTLSRANASLKYADRLENAASGATGARAADLLSEAADVRRQVATDVVGNQEALTFLNRQLGKGDDSLWSNTGVGQMFKAPDPPPARAPAAAPSPQVAGLPAATSGLPRATAPRAPPRPLPVVRNQPGPGTTPARSPAASPTPRPVPGAAPRTTSPTPTPTPRTTPSPTPPSRATSSPTPQPTPRPTPGSAPDAPPAVAAAGTPPRAPDAPAPVASPPLRSTPIDDTGTVILKSGADPFPPRTAAAAAAVPPAGAVPRGVPPVVRGAAAPTPGLPPVVRGAAAPAPRRPVANIPDDTGTVILRGGKPVQPQPAGPVKLATTPTGKKTARVTEVKQKDGVRTYEVATSDGKTRRIAFTEETLGKPGYTSRVHVNADNPDEVIRFTNLREDKVGHALDEAGRGVFAGKFGAKPDSDIIDVAARGDNFLVVDDLGRPLYHAEVVKKADNIADGLNPSEMTAGQRIAIDRAHRELNNKGYVWLDNKRDNYSLVQVGDGDNWKVVVIDAGGVLPVKGVTRGGKTLSPADVAREIQRKVNIPDDSIRSIDRVHWDGIASGHRGEVLDEFADAFDVDKVKNFDGRSLVSPESVHFNPRGHYDMPDQSRLFEMSDADAAKAYDALRAGKNADVVPDVGGPGGTQKLSRAELEAAGVTGPGGTQKLSRAELEAAGVTSPGGTQKLSRAELEAAGVTGPGGTQRLSLAELEAAGVVRPARASSPDPFDAPPPGASKAAVETARANAAKAAEVRSRVPGDIVDPKTVSRAQSRFTEMKRRARGKPEEKEAVQFARDQLADAKKRSRDLTRARKAFERTQKRHKAKKINQEALDEAARTLRVTERTIEAGEIRAARELVEHLHDRRFFGRASDGELKDAVRHLEKLEARADTKRALRELEADQNLRADILKDAIDAKKPLTQADLDWLSGKRRKLTPEEEQWADEMLRSAGDWSALTAKMDMPGGPTKLEMHKIVTYRKKIVDEMLDGVIQRVQRETGLPLRRKAFGSTNLDSDYDLSIDGPGAERVVAEFNNLYRRRFGDEAGVLFDTNVYTDPVYNLFKRNDLKGLDLGPGQDDMFRQFLFSQVATRKYFTDAQWARHVDGLKKSVRGNRDMRRMVDSALARAEGIEKGMKGQLAGRIDRLRREAAARGLKPSQKSLEMRAQNDLYADSLARIDSLREEVDLLDKLGPKHLDLVASRSTLRRDVPRYGQAIDDIKRLYREGKIAEADALKAKWRQQLAHELRDNQGKALYFASEAYQAQGTIAHVVAEIQAGGKKIDLSSLSAKPKRGIPDDARAGYLNSFDENRANMFKELNGVRAKGKPNPAKEAAKVAKYFIRQLDAAHEAGIDLTRRLPNAKKLLQATVGGNATRADKAKLLAALKKAGYDDPMDFVRAAEKASDILAARGMRISPIRKLSRQFRKARKEVDQLLADPRFKTIDPATERALNDALKTAGAPPGRPPGGGGSGGPAAGAPGGPGGTQKLTRAELEAAGVFDGPGKTQRLSRAELEAAGVVPPRTITPDPDELFRRVALQTEFELAGPAIPAPKVPENPVKLAAATPEALPARAAGKADVPKSAPSSTASAPSSSPSSSSGQVASAPPARHPLDLSPSQIKRPPQSVVRVQGNVDTGSPRLGETWQGPDGTTFGIGRKEIGSGRDATVYDITDGEFKGDVLKTYADPPPSSNEYAPSFTASDVVNDVMHGADVLKKHGILSLKTKRGVTGTGRPYVVQEKLRPGDLVINEKGKLRPEHQRAVAELYEEMARKGIVWEDGHHGNIFLREVDGKWRAGVLDTDRIFEWGHVPSERTAFLLDSVRTVGFAKEITPGVVNKVANMKSLAFKPHFWTPDSPKEFMAKMLEYNGWIDFDGKVFRASRMDPDALKGRFDLKGPPPSPPSARGPTP